MKIKKEKQEPTQSKFSLFSSNNLIDNNVKRKIKIIRIKKRRILRDKLTLSSKSTGKGASRSAWWNLWREWYGGETKLVRLGKDSSVIWLNLGNMILPTGAEAMEEYDIAVKWFLELPQLHICLHFGRPINVSFPNLGRSSTCPSSTFSPSRSNTWSSWSQYSTISTSKFCNKLGGNSFNSDTQFFNLRDRRLPPKESRSWPSLISCNMRTSESVEYNIDVLQILT